MSDKLVLKAGWLRDDVQKASERVRDLSGANRPSNSPQIEQKQQEQWKDASNKDARRP